MSRQDPITPSSKPRVTVSNICDPRTLAMSASSSDSELFDRELRAFVPPNAFDVHAHLYDFAAIGSWPAEAGDSRVGYETYLRCQRRWMGDRAPVDGLFFPFPTRTLDCPAANHYLRGQLADRPQSRGLMMIRPTDDPARVEAEVRKNHWSGFKVYHVFANRTDTANAEIGEFLPEWAWEIAHRHQLAITLHMMLARSLADERNQVYIREHCLRYPGAKLILAHAGRGFCADHTVKGVESLRGIGNVFFDTSAICEPAGFEAILRVFGVSRLMYGGDFPVTEVRGKAISAGDGFVWLYAENFDERDEMFGRFTLVGIESLLAVKQACRTSALSDADIERIFCTNARQLLGITIPSGAIGQEEYRVAKQIIPGGTQLLSKRPEMYAPDRWPPYFVEAHGCEVIDVDGRRFVDFSTNGIGSCLLGYADSDVTDAVVRRARLGAMSTLNPPEELELARMLIALHPWAEQARFARAGGEAMAVAIRIARAATKRDAIAFCGYHGWQDWYLAANLSDDAALDGHLLPGLAPAGVPRGLRGSAIPFAFNQLDALAKIVRERGSELAAVVMEPTRNVDPNPGFLEGVRELCDRNGIKLVFDEITAGFRLHRGGAHLRYGVTPDVAVFAKALGNGHPIAAIVGKSDTMSAAQTSFISSTYWTESIGPTAAVATLKKMQRVDVPAHVARIGTRWREGMSKFTKRHDINLKISGHPALTYLAFDHPEVAALLTLLTVRMLDRGYLAGGGFYPTLAHTDQHVDAFLVAADEVFAEIAQAVRAGDSMTRIGGLVRHTGFARLA